MEKKYQVNPKDNYTLISVLSQKFDTNITPIFKSELIMLIGSGVKNIVIDLSKTNYCDFSGLSSILLADRLCRSKKGKFVLTGLQNAVEKLISISSHLNTDLIITDTIEQAEIKILS